MMYDTVQSTGTKVPSFTDLDTQSPYYTAVVWAQGKGLVNGYGTSRFGAEDTLTVPQAMMILYRYAGSP